MTVGEFYQKYESLRERLSEMSKSKVLALSNLAKRDLEEITQAYDNLKAINKNSSTQIRGIKTELFGLVTIEGIEEFVEKYSQIALKYK